MPAKCIGSLIFLTGIAVTSFSSQSAEKLEKDSVDRDYTKELPRTPALKPSEAIKSFTVAPGFRIEQVAAEPLVNDPIALAFDEDSRLFVVEMRGYSEDGEKNLGQIRLLEDTNDDGKFDKSTVFTDGLSWPTAITCSNGGIFVGAAPNIYYFKDTNRDGKADIRQVVYTGFGRGNVQGLLNTFKWGLDNRIHGATSSSGAVVKLKTQKVGDTNQGTRGDDQQAKPLSLRVLPYYIFTCTNSRRVAVYPVWPC